jgi:hypothetical protein
MIALGVAAISYPLLRALNPPWVQLDSTGIAHGGPRFVRHSPRRAYVAGRDCGPFAVRSHEAAVCELARGRFELDDKFGGLEDGTQVR